MKKFRKREEAVVGRVIDGNVTIQESMESKNQNRKELTLINIEGKNAKETVEAVLYGIRECCARVPLTITGIYEKENELRVISSYEDTAYIAAGSIIYDKSKRGFCIDFKCRDKSIVDSVFNIVVDTDFMLTAEYFDAEKFRVIVESSLLAGFARLHPMCWQKSVEDTVKSTMNRCSFISSKPR